MLLGSVLYLNFVIRPKNTGAVGVLTIRGFTPVYSVRRPRFFLLLSVTVHKRSRKYYRIKFM